MKQSEDLVVITRILFINKQTTWFLAKKKKQNKTKQTNNLVP